jgi:hypothetical protein
MIKSSRPGVYLPASLAIYLLTYRLTDKLTTGSLLATHCPLFIPDEAHFRRYGCGARNWPRTAPAG